MRNAGRKPARKRAGEARPPSSAGTSSAERRDLERGGEAERDAGPAVAAAHEQGGGEDAEEDRRRLGVRRRPRLQDDRGAEQVEHRRAQAELARGEEPHRRRGGEVERAEDQLEEDDFGARRRPRVAPARPRGVTAATPRKTASVSGG